MVTYKGEVFPGRHEALVTPELFERVRRVMDVRVQRNQRDIVHNHFLRAMLHCDRCGQQGRIRQLIFSQPVNRAGQAYQYYFCRGAEGHKCGLPNLRIADVEDAIQREVSRLKLAPDEAAAVRAETTRHLEKRLAVEKDSRARLKKELASLDVKESGSST
ncbi:MAG TPA: hypothetical protein PKE40_12335 [Arachnia sp.]|nr:hypothetical protein [Arachnia sp.]HMT87133.1 hypothetical protein [Arachnia sp.]